MAAPCAGRNNWLDGRTKNLALGGKVRKCSSFPAKWGALPHKIKAHLCTRTRADLAESRIFGNFRVFKSVQKSFHELFADLIILKRTNFMTPPQIQNQDQITIQFNGQISISRQNLKMLLAELRSENPIIIPAPVSPPPPPQPSVTMTPPAIINLAENSGNKRLAYTMRETTEILGVSYITVHRLVKRGLLRNSKVLRSIIIPASEIERFLKDTL